MGKRWQMPTGAVKCGKREKEPVAKGHIAIYAGKDGRRFVVPLSYLRHPNLQVLPEHGRGGVRVLTIPCEASFLRKSIDLVRGKLSSQTLNSLKEMLGSKRRVGLNFFCMARLGFDRTTYLMHPIHVHYCT